SGREDLNLRPLAPEAGLARLDRARPPSQASHLSHTSHRTTGVCRGRATLCREEDTIRSDSDRVFRSAAAAGLRAEFPLQRPSPPGERWDEMNVSSPVDPPLTVLLARFREGDTGALAAIFDRTARGLFRSALHLAPDAAS